MRKACVVLAAILLMLAGACASDEGGENITAASPDTSTAASQPPSGECTDLTGNASGAPIEQMDSPFRFDPACAIIKTSQGLSIVNNGSVTHNLSVEGFAGIDVDVEPGQTNNTETTGLEAGTYAFFCKFHRASGMEGELRVQ